MSPYLPIPPLYGAVTLLLLGNIMIPPPHNLARYMHLLQLLIYLTYREIISRVDGRRYSPMSRVHCSTEKNSQLTMLGPWKPMNLTIHPYGLSPMTMTNPPFAPLEVAITAWEHTLL